MMYSILQRLIQNGTRHNSKFQPVMCKSITSVAGQQKVDPLQESALSEECIIVDDNDNAIGKESKKNCHLVQNGTCLLHRAFSVFLFNSKGELLVQQRSEHKITFPSHYTNTCCSHPLYVPDELEEKAALGVKRAAQRRLEYELGIPPSQAPVDAFKYITRIHYQSASGIGKWGEHEIDYILFLLGDVDLNPNPNEVSDVRFIAQNNFYDFLKGLERRRIPITPWFSLIVKSKLHLWWNNLHNLEKFEDHQTIHRL